jgi:outer membrane protein OmpA-like peptidoglycan-associated protein
MASDHEGAGLSSSLTDLMTSLAVIFILLLVAMLQNQRQQAAGAMNLVLSRLQTALQKFKERGVEIKSDPKDPLVLLVIVPEGLLKFGQGDFNIPGAGAEFLRTFVPNFVPTACSTDIREGISSIVVEGHASSEAKKESDNIRLSQQRSMAVVQQILAILQDAHQDDKCFLDLVSASGRGKAETIPKENGEEDRERSRRVVFKVRIKSLEERKEIAAPAELSNLLPAPR